MDIPVLIHALHFHTWSTGTCKLWFVEFYAVWNTNYFMYFNLVLIFSFWGKIFSLLMIAVIYMLNLYIQKYQYLNKFKAHWFINSCSLHGSLGSNYNRFNNFNYIYFSNVCFPILKAKLDTLLVKVVKLLIVGKTHPVKWNSFMGIRFFFSSNRVGRISWFG